MASITKRPNGKYRARYRDSSGKEHARHFAKKGSAQAWLDEVTADRLHGVELDLALSKVAFGAYAADWLARQTVETSTREAMQSRLTNHLLPTFGAMPVNGIRPSHIQAWLSGLQDQLAPRTIRVVLANLSSILKAAVDDQIIRRNPCEARSVSAPKLDEKVLTVWTDEQVDALIGEIPEPYRAVPELAAFAGLRQGECFGLRVQDVNWLGKELHVRNQIKVEAGKVVQAPPKRRKERMVPAGERVLFALAKRLEDHEPIDGLFFSTRESKPINRNYWNGAIWKPALVRAGIEPTRENGMHALRHYFASVLLDGGVSVRALADYLGHSDPGFTLRVYTHLMPKSEDRVRAVIDAKPGSSADSLRTAGANHA